ncbi:MAG: demethoxyubiquinone hydroxylase family protein [Rickettsiaceae bacterium]|nr:demethoxyubiquinone hydroxylase family protein [Rickettsiaceae bacterium]
MQRPQFNFPKKIEEIIRVNYVGEYGAVRIYEGQISGCAASEAREEIVKMKSQEEIHLAYFSDQMKKRNIRPSIMMGLWHKFGFALGHITSSNMKMSMICTESIETEIEKHYQSQIEFLNESSKEQELKKYIKKFQLEEIEHKEIASDQIDNKLSVFEGVSSLLIKQLCRIAIKISKKI